MLGMDIPTEEYHRTEREVVVEEALNLKQALQQPTEGLPVKPAEPLQEDSKIAEPMQVAEVPKGINEIEAPIQNATEVEASSDKIITPLIREQLKHCATTLKGLKRHPQASPFQVPVDPVALGIPDYLTVITHPMDLSTITRKLDAFEYDSPELFAADVKLMLENCFTYNKPETQVYQMGKALEKYFMNAYAKLPTKLAPAQNDDFGGAKRRKSETGSPAARPKRDSVTPRRTSVIPASTTGGRTKRATPEITYCMNTWKELTKKANFPFAWPFLEPVDPVKLGIPDYSTVITNPMDLSTIKKKLDAAVYNTAEEFEADVKLMLKNCYTYNGPDSDVGKLGKELEGVFDKKWGLRPIPGQTPVHTGSVPRYDEYDDDSEKILALNKQIQALQAELNELLMKRRNVPSKPAPKSRSKSTTVHHAVSDVSALPSPNAPMSFEEKRQLSVDVNNLSPEKLGRVVEIIHNSMPYLQQQSDSDVIELDIESLDVGTLRQLQKYIVECKNAIKKRKMSSTAGSARPKKTAAMSASTAPVLEEGLSSDDSSSSDDDL